MPEVNEPTSQPAQPSAIPSPLGVDTAPDLEAGLAPEVAAPAAPGVDATLAEAPVAPAPQQQVVTPEPPDMSPEEYSSLLEKANVYDLINADPQLVNSVNEHFRSKTGTPQAPTENEVAQQQQADPRFDQLIQENKSLREKQASIEINLFRQQNPDMQDVEQEMASMIRQYNMPLNEAYKYAKAAKAQSAPPQNLQQEAPALPTAEGKVVGPVPTDLDPLAVASRKINDPNVTKNIGDAMGVAINAALAQSNQAD